MFSFGILQRYLQSHAPFNQDANGIASIGTTVAGCMYLLMPVYFAVLQRWPFLKRYFIWAGLSILTGSLIAASFASTTHELIALQGVLYAIGGNMLFAPTMTYLDEWFVQRKGLAIGIMWAGDGSGGVVIPLILQHLLDRYGFRISLRCYACATIILLGPLLPFVKPRLPIPAVSTSRPVGVAFLRSPVFWVLEICNVIQAAGYFLPINYLPSYAETVGLTSNSIGSLLLVLVNVASIFGCIAIGFLMDRVKVTSVLFVTSLTASVSILGLWGMSADVAALCIFALLYGFTASSYSTAWTGIIKAVQATTEGADANVIFGFLAAGRGVGSIISGPLSEILISFDGRFDETTSHTAYYSEYRALVIFAGCSAFIGGLGWIAQKARLI